MSEPIQSAAELLLGIHSTREARALLLSALFTHAYNKLLREMREALTREALTREALEALYPCIGALVAVAPLDQAHEVLDELNRAYNNARYTLRVIYFGIIYGTPGKQPRGAEAVHGLY